MLQWLRHKLASWLFPDLESTVADFHSKLQQHTDTLQAVGHDIGDLAGELNALRNRLADAPPAQPKPEPRRFATWSATKAALERKSA